MASAFYSKMNLGKENLSSGICRSRHYTGIDKQLQKSL